MMRFSRKGSDIKVPQKYIERICNAKADVRYATCAIKLRSDDFQTVNAHRTQRDLSSSGHQNRGPGN